MIKALLILAIVLFIYSVKEVYSINQLLRK